MVNINSYFESVTDSIRNIAVAQSLPETLNSFEAVVFLNDGEMIKISVYDNKFKVRYNTRLKDFSPCFVTSYCLSTDYG